MRLTVCGNDGTCPKKDGACSSYLLEIGNKKILVDLGNGATAKLQEKVALEEIDCIIISHLHFDHFADLIPFKYALETKMTLGKKLKPKKLFIPLLPSWLKAELETNDVFEIITIMDGQRISLDEITIDFVKVVHLVDSFAISICEKEKRFVYSSDTGLCPQVIAIAKNANLFLCEATFVRNEGEQLKHHLSASEAAVVAQKASVKKLLLTHLWMGEAEEAYRAEAKRYFKNVEICKILQTYDI